MTLLTPPLPYENREGVYTPAYQTWGYGLRYIEQEHANNIVAASLATAKLALPNASTSQATVILRQIDVLTRIAEQYGLRVSADKSGRRSAVRTAAGGLPDAEVGYAGERLIYEREIAYVQSINRDPSEVEWVSQSVPTSPYDIKTIRQVPSGVREHFIEVKSSAALEDTNVYISSGQVAFFEDHQGRATIALVKFSVSQPPVIRELTFSELRAEFDLVPIKFKLEPRASAA